MTIPNTLDEAVDLLLTFEGIDEPPKEQDDDQ
jgi:hypothetical protein